METMKKKITLGLVAMGLASAAAQAGHPAPDVSMPIANPILVTVPEQDSSWSVGIEALYWMPTGADLQYATNQSGVNTNNNSASTRQTHVADNDYAWGARIDATYHMPVQGKDVELAWAHFGKDWTDTKNTVNRSAGSLYLPWDLFSGGAATDFNSVSAKSFYSYNSVDLHFGQKVKVGDNLMLHPFAGLRWSDIDSKNEVLAFSAATTNNNNTSESQAWNIHTDFKGIGPRAGIDGGFNLGGGFGISGRAGASLLVGVTEASQKQSTTVSSTNSSIVNGLDRKMSNSTRVVPEADAKLGINYGRTFNQRYSGIFELGFEANHYFNALDKSYLAQNDGVSRSSDFSWNGPYARFQLDIA